MAWDRDLEDLMATTVTVTAAGAVTRDAYGAESYTSVGSSTYPARVTLKSEEVRTNDGQIAQSSHVAWIASTGALTTDQRYTLADGSTPTPLRVERLSDEDGVYHHKVWFGLKGG